MTTSSDNETVKCATCGQWLRRVKWEGEQTLPAFWIHEVDPSHAPSAIGDEAAQRDALIEALAALGGAIEQIKALGSTPTDNATSALAYGIKVARLREALTTARPDAAPEAAVTLVIPDGADTRTSGRVEVYSSTQPYPGAPFVTTRGVGTHPVAPAVAPALLDEARKAYGAWREPLGWTTPSPAETWAAGYEAGRADVRAPASSRLAELEAAKDGAYSERNKTVVALAWMASRSGYRVGTREHVGEEWDDDWRAILMIDLPTGQASWHFHDSDRPMLSGFPVYPDEWDGHTTEEKYERLAALGQQPSPPAAPTLDEDK